MNPKKPNAATTRATKQNKQRAHANATRPSDAVADAVAVAVAAVRAKK